MGVREDGFMVTPRPLIDSVVRSVCGRAIERIVPLSGGGMNETYRVQLSSDRAVIVRIARQSVPWFTDEAHLMARARDVGVATPEVLGVEHLDHDGDLLSLSIQQLVPGRPLDELLGLLTSADLEQLVVDAGELLARVHSIASDRGTRHPLRVPAPSVVTCIARTVGEVLGERAAAVVEQGADFLRAEIADHPPPLRSLAQGDFLPKNILIDDGAIVAVIDWEFAGPAPPAFDLARWEVSAGHPLHDRSDLLRRGYARIADPKPAAANLVPAYAIDWALEMLGWDNTATPAQFRRCVEVIARYTAA